MPGRDVWFIGDEVTAAGFRLAGLRVAVPGPGEAARCFAEACEGAGVIYLTGEAAAGIPAGVLEPARRGADPLVLIVPDLNGRSAPPDMERRILGFLGLDA